MQKWKSVVFLTFLALIGLIVGLGRVAKNQKGTATPEPSASASATAAATAAPQPSASEQEATAAEPPPAASGPTPASALPANAPNEVVFGAILVTFEGAQGAPSKARSKTAALEIAQRILATAQTSFEDAVRMGDPGSMANAGTMRRGILEPTLEYTLFTLEKGAVCPEPLETPRGYWIMRRIK
jgi:predicted lipid-binding transport protein (Tim44 family)